MKTDTQTPRTTPIGGRVLRITSKALPEHNRRHNRSLVLQTLFRNGSMSRADVARASGLTRVTVSELIRDLTTDGIVKELGLRTGSRIGKPATLLAINPNASHIIALDLSDGDRFLGAIVDLRGNVLHRAELETHGALGEQAFTIVGELCELLLQSVSEAILGIGIGSPGIVDHNGIVLEAPNLGWFRLPIAERLSRRFNIPTYVGNDANAAALGVHTFREMSGQSLMVVTIKHGVGAGLIIGGALVEGEQFSAGEIGHVIVDEDGERCVCGRHGCLELAVAAPRLKRRIALAQQGDRERVLSEAGRALGIALSPIVSILNLNDIVLSGPTEILSGALLNAVDATIRHRTMSAVSNGLTVRLAEGSHDLVLLGAAVLVLSAELGVS